MTKLTLDSTSLIDVLLGSETTADVVDTVVERLTMIVLPWRPNSCHPPKFERRTASGYLVGVVDSFLGGYSNPHKPHLHGWGYQGSSPHGSTCTRGIVTVDTEHLVFDDPSSKDTIKMCEKAARIQAQKIVDEFLREEFPGLLLLSE